VSDQPPPWDAFGQQDPRQGQPQYPPQQQPYGQQPYPQGQPPYGQQAPYMQQQTQGFSGQQPQPPYGPRKGRRSRQSWPGRHKVLTVLGGVLGAFILIGIIGAAAGAGATSTKTVTVPGPTVTVTQAAPAVTVTAPAVRVRVTVTPSANAQGEATQISADGVYVVGQDIPGGTWHTSGGSQCYEATLASTDTSNIIDNNNFTGPNTVSLAGAKAFNISGGCTWRQEG
jgi:hypothetical protein